jgi:hypothetical protein
MRKLFWVIAIASIAGLGQPLLAQSFTPGNIVVVRTGDGTNPMNGTTRPVSLLEINPISGAVVTTTNLPSAAATNLTLQGTSVFGDGFLSLGSDNVYLSLMGHNVVAGSNGALTTSYTIARVDLDRNVNVSTTTTTSAPGLVPNGSAALYPNSIYGAFGSPSGPGLGTTTAGSNATLTTLSNTNSFINPQVVNNQLYAIQGLNTIVRTNPALPTSSAGLTFSTLTSTVNSSAFATGFLLLDRDAGVAGLDTLYIVSDQGMDKFSFNGTTWTSRGTIAGSFFGIAGVVNGANANIFLTTGDGSLVNNSLQSFVDTTAFNANITGTPTNLGSSAGADFNFGGLAFTPTAVPEPATWAMIGLVNAVGFGWYLRRRSHNVKRIQQRFKASRK